MISQPDDLQALPLGFSRSPSAALVDALAPGGPLLSITELVRTDLLWDLGFRGSRVDVYRARRCVAPAAARVRTPRPRESGQGGRRDRPFGRRLDIVRHRDQTGCEGHRKGRGPGLLVCRSIRSWASAHSELAAAELRGLASARHRLGLAGPPADEIAIRRVASVIALPSTASAHVLDVTSPARELEVAFGHDGQAPLLWPVEIGHR